MKKLAGTMRLDLAQYRDTAAFAQFGSDLDKATMEQIARGERVFELLKQRQYEPIPVEEQIVQIFAATTPRNKESNETWVRRYTVKEITRYAAELTAFMRSKHSALLTEIRDNPKVKLEGEFVEKLRKALADFEAVFDGAKADR